MTCTHLVGFLILIWAWAQGSKAQSPELADDALPPTVFISVLVRNKGHTLPYFLGCLENLDYPKSRISLHIQTDHNSDSSLDILQEWTTRIQEFYHDVVLLSTSEVIYEDRGRVFEWSPKRMEHVISLRQRALKAARKSWADYYLSLDADHFLTNPMTIQILQRHQKTVIAPLLGSALSSYANFWAAMSREGYYESVPEYHEILNGTKVGVHSVPLVHGAVLINLKRTKSQLLSYDPKTLRSYLGPKDDIITFAFSARAAGVEMFIANEVHFGSLLEPLEAHLHNLETDKEQLRHLLLESLDGGPPGILYSPYIHPRFQPPDKLGMDEVYLINLDRRVDRLDRMSAAFLILGINATRISAADGQALTEPYLKALNVQMIPEFLDPHSQRPMTRGEIGCFLSHYKIWEDMVEKSHATALVLEDDLRFVPGFRGQFADLLTEVKDLELAWDLIYVGRKRLSGNHEKPMVKGAKLISHVGYTYWTLGYIISLSGAQKLLNSRPFEKLVPVDEFLPIMFDEHPEIVWANYYQNRNLRAFSAEPLLVYPLKYTGQDGYVSDTEASAIWREESEKSDMMGDRGEVISDSIFEPIKDEL